MEFYFIIILEQFIGGSCLLRSMCFRLGGVVRILGNFRVIFPLGDIKFHI